MSDYRQVEHAIALLEAQRALLGDAVVDMALAPLLAQLAALQVPQTAPQRKHATILFADLSGFTAMSETMDAEDVNDMMNALWTALDRVIISHGGMIDKHMGDAIMALWGGQTAREDDPERAIRAALAMQTALAEFRAVQQAALQMRIGINTGLVLLGPVGTTQELTAIGDAVNLASRLEHAAPLGEVLISHDTYRHVRGIFSVTPQVALNVKGKREPIQTYLVHGAMPRAFRLATRGIEGIETRMIGREEELFRLQNTLRTVMDDGELHAMTVIGEAGIGKSRLLYEFRSWIDLLPEAIWIFHGRATQEMRHLPYALLRDVLSFRFDILDSDSPQTARAKLEHGILTFCGPADREAVRTAHLIGQLIGVDFADSPYLHTVDAHAAHIQEQALLALTRFFVAATSERPAVVLLEDIHWADTGSLEAMLTLIRQAPAMRLMILCMARPTLLEQRPAWAEGLPAHRRLLLQPLTSDESRALVSEILRYVANVPAELPEMIVGGAEGNPYYVEELIKMLIEEGVIIPWEENWRIERSRLSTIQVPPTLAGILQARIDSLSLPERILLQGAATLGRVFWDDALVALGIADRVTVQQHLTTLRQRELIYRHAPSAFGGTTEYLFRHALLREVVYEGTLKSQRRRYHERAAAWLEQQAGARVETYAGLIAEHYEHAGVPTLAGRWWVRAGTQALAVTEPQAAIAAYQRALTLLSEDERAQPLLLLSRSLDLVGEWERANAHYEAVLTLADAQGDMRSYAQACFGLGESARKRGDYASALPWLNEAHDRFAHLQDSHGRCQVLIELSSLQRRQGNTLQTATLLEEALTLAQDHHFSAEMAYALQMMAYLAQTEGQLDKAEKLFEQSLEHARTARLWERIGNVLTALGMNAFQQGDLIRAHRLLEEAHTRFVELAAPFGIAITTINLAHVLFRLGQYHAAHTHYCQGMNVLWRMGDPGSATTGLIGIAAVLTAAQPTAAQVCQALRLLSAATTVLAQIPRVLDREDQEIFDAAQGRIAAALPPEEYAAVWADGATLSLEAAMAEAVGAVPQ
jgi:predicted ATPase/class 3 adenylate cyclase